MRAVYEFIEKAAGSELSATIAGETGTGKSVIARAIHQGSGRAKGPFVVVNCGALPETLLESELFGHQKGAFTGAFQERKGKILSAHGGTLFLDEVATLSLAAQSKLLQALEEKQFDPLGGDRPVRADIRVIAATNEDLGEAVKSGKFRKDLYYRLQVLSLRVAPLRERKEDIPLLIDHFLRRPDGTGIPVAPEAMNCLLGHDWPGNVRELENVLKAASAGLKNGILSRDNLTEAVRGTAKPNGLCPGGGDALKDKVSVFEKCLIEEALRRTRGNVAKAARELSCPHRSLKRKLAYYRISPRELSPSEDHK
jgi:two-component system NtrC family response regulator